MSYTEQKDAVLSRIAKNTGNLHKKYYKVKKLFNLSKICVTKSLGDCKVATGFPNSKANMQLIHVAFGASYKLNVSTELVSY